MDYTISRGAVSISFDGRGGRVRIRAGGRRSLPVVIRSKVPVSLEAFPEWVRPEPRVLERGGSHRVSLVLTPEVAQGGVRPRLRLNYESRLGLFSMYCEAELPLHVDVIPRTLLAIARALEFLGGAGLGGGGGRPTRLGREGEYFGSKRYEAGDSPRRIDWKATARTGELYVKRFLESGGRVVVAYDVRVPGPLAADKVASALVTLVTARAREGELVDIILVDGNRAHKVSARDPRHALLKAIGIALKTVRVEPRELDELVVPEPSRAVKALLGLAVSEAEKEFLKLKAAALEAHKLLVPPPDSEIALISSLTGDVQEIVETKQAAEAVGSRLVLLIPSRPWLDAANVQRARKRYEALIAYLKRARIPVVYIS